VYRSVVAATLASISAIASSSVIQTVIADFMVSVISPQSSCGSSNMYSTECVQEPTNCPTSKRSVDPVNCDKHCHQPWLKCMSKCGDSEFCSHKCNCKLFQSSLSLCRHAGGDHYISCNCATPLTTSNRMCPEARKLPRPRQT
jgi:hypothetical protein